MRLTNTFRHASAASLFLIAVLGLAMLSGCPDESADMASQISGGESHKSPPPADAGKTADTAEQAAGAKGLARPGTEEAPAEGEAEPVLIVDVEILDKEVKPPFPEYDAEGLYDVMLEVLAPKDPETGLSYGTRVWEIVAMDKDGTEVASLVKQIKVPDHKPGTLRFNGVYCLSMPENFEFRLSERQAAAADAAPGEKDGTGGREGEGDGGPKRGLGGSGGSGGDGGSEEGGGGGEEDPAPEGDE